MTRFAVLVGLLVANCTCTKGETPSTEAQPPVALAGPEGWALGADSGRFPIVLPPPCTLAEPVWTSVVAGRTEFVAAPDLLGELMVRNGPQQHETMGRMRMALGQADVIAWAIPANSSHVAAMGSPWMLVGSTLDRTAVWLQRAPGTAHETLTRGEGLEVAASRCQDAHCAVLVRSAEAQDGGREHTVYLGDANEATGQWRRVELSKGVVSTRLASIDRVESDSAVVALDVGGGVEWRRIGREASRVVATLALNEAPLASAFGPDDTAWVAATPSRGPDGLDNGGLRIASSRSAAVELRAPTKATRVTLHPVGTAAVVWWLAPRASGGEQRLLHAAVVSGGRAVGPIAIAAEADDVAFSAHGERIDVWVQDDGSVTYAQVRCVVGTAPPPLLRESTP